MKVTDNQGVSLVVGFEPMWTKRNIGFCGFFAYSLAIVAAGLLLNHSPVRAMSLFAGITGIEAAQLQTDGTQVLRLTADLPFQYQTQVLDADHVVLRIYNAQLGQPLLTPDGTINLLVGGAIESARLRRVSDQAQASMPYQEIELSGAGLGHLKLKILGGEALPVSITVPSMPSSEISAKSPPSINNPKRATIKQSAEAKLGAPASAHNSKTQSIQVATSQYAAKPVEENKTFDALLSQPVAMMAVSSDSQLVSRSAQGPQISSVRNLSGSTLIQSATATSTEVSLPATVSAQSLSNRAPAIDSAVNEPSPPEPSYQALTALPRYRGGAAPIQAMTTDASGNPIIIRPKNQPLPEFDIHSSPESFNVLLQAEGTPAQQRVASLMAESLKAYHGKQYAKALPLILQALQLQTDNADLYAALGEIQGQLAQKQEAMKAYARAYQYNPEQYGQAYAQALVLVGQRSKAIEVLEGLYVKNPTQAGVAYMLGTLYEELGQTEQALPYLKQAAELRPGSVDIQYNLGLAYELSGDNLLAERHYQRALKLDADAQDVQKALARVREASRD